MESFRGRIIPLVEECVERFQDEGLVLFGCSLRHVDSFLSLGVFDRTHDGTFMRFERDQADLPSNCNPSVADREVWAMRPGENSRHVGQTMQTP